jgi:predicted TIM-barrel fold metal-dependent hydrolase
MTRAEATALPVVDAHHHLWDLSRGRYPWLQQDYDAEGFFLGDYRPLCADFLPDDYRRTSAGCQVVATVHVEAERERSEQLAETAWLHEVHARHGFPIAVVAFVFLDRPDTEQRLLEHLRYPLLRGIRNKPRTARTPDAMAVLRGQPGTMQDEAWLRGLALLQKHGLSWDLRVPAWHLSEAAEVAAMFPALPIVLNHHGFAWDRSDAGMALWREGMRRLAQQPNVHVKLSEFGRRDAGWDLASNTRIVHETLQIFGPQRCMFASNFPVAGLRIGFAELVTAMRSMLGALTAQQQRAVMCDNALRFYRMADPA